MTKEQEFTKQTEEAKFEAFSVMCKKVTELEKEYASLKGLRKYELNVAKLEIEKLEKENTELKATLNAINQLIPELEKMFDNLLKMTEQEADK